MIMKKRIFPSETIEAITNFLFIGMSEVEEVYSKYDLVIVLGNNMIKETINELCKLRDSKCFTNEVTLKLSGNCGQLSDTKVPESVRLYRIALEEGFPKNMLLQEKMATNTLENFKFSKEIIQSSKDLQAFQSILVIGNAFLMRRAKMCAAACHYPMEKVEYYGISEKGDRNIGADSWWKSEEAVRRVMEELGRISAYTLKGDLSIN